MKLTSDLFGFLLISGSVTRILDDIYIGEGIE